MSARHRWTSRGLVGECACGLRIRLVRGGPRGGFFREWYVVNARGLVTRAWRGLTPPHPVPAEATTPATLLKEAET